MKTRDENSEGTNMKATGYDARTQTLINRMTNEVERLMATPDPFKSHEVLHTFERALYEVVSEEIRRDMFATFESDRTRYRDMITTEWLCRNVCTNCGEDLGHPGEC